MISTYRIVPPSEAHLVVTPWGRWVASPDESVATKGRKAYFAIPILFAIRRLDVTIKELVVTQDTYEKNQARYEVKSSIKYRITDVMTAAERYINDEALQKQLTEVVKASVRAITVKYEVQDARANKHLMSEEILKQIKDDMGQWGLTLVNFQLIDFQDTAESKIISDISKRREVEIQAITRERNAEKIKQARMKEAEADEKAQEREIKRDEIVGMKEQNKIQQIAEQEKLAREKEYEVKRVMAVKQAEIDKEAEMVVKEKKQLEGEGDRLKAEQVAKGDAAPIREKGYAEADAKEKLQDALNKFKSEAIRALVAEQVVSMQENVGIATAEALSKADLKVFAGGGQAQSGFDLGRMIQSLQVADDSTARSVLNRIGRPNDLGLSNLGFLLPNNTDGSVGEGEDGRRDQKVTREDKGRGEKVSKVKK